MQLAVFGPKIFSTSLNRIYPFGDFSASGSISKETQEREGQKPATYIKGLGLESISVGVPLVKQKDVDIRKEWESWKSIRDARVPYYFILAGKPIIPNKLILESVDLTDPVFSPGGEIVRGTIQLKFEEYAAAGSKKASEAAKKRENPNYAQSELQGDELAEIADDLL